jgi:spore coat polysaccharide biosynthesis predicted glycosyltransferase SpsG
LSDYVFHFDVGGRIGFGHMQRCRTLARAARARGAGITFLLGLSDPETPILLRSEGFQVDLLDSFRPSGGDAIVIDRVHADTLQKVESLQSQIDALRKAFRRFVIIDGGGEQALRSRLDIKAEDIVVAPYVGEVAGPNDRCRIIAGPQFAILDPIYAELPVRVGPLGHKVLISCGGSDPAGLTCVALDALDLITHIELDVRVIVGAGFRTDLQERIETTAGRSSHRMTIVRSLQNLRVEMLNCACAITTSGLTKYELAATATPTIIVPLDAKHAENDRRFACAGGAEVLAATAANLESLAEMVKSILTDQRRWQTMSQAGRSLIDGRGVWRLLDNLEEIKYATRTH